ncbi:hypothetical protein KIPB_000788 [Kipferlia bialata]|uniref:Translation elongation factor EF1B beta/delta subunit guanine nucleotide exchange domain-containing protein n=1 Tax=Kipferlia bialata TaxID=797122 RepID=A0A391NRR4_9EUKA|nr:hypothetical protein KIPB_000788 [Kipferlia bialata]|eukprot:g788.t1
MSDSEGSDLFGGDEEIHDSDYEAEERIRKAALEHNKAKAARDAAAGKKKAAAQSMIVLEIKPYDEETDLKKLAESIRNKITKEGLKWGEDTLADMAFGLQKLIFPLSIVDDLVSIDDDVIMVIEEEFEDDVQSIEIAAFNKL